MKEKKQKRFIKTYEQDGLVFCADIIVDTVTGVNYLICSYGNSGGVTPLLDADGKPVVTPVKPETPDPELHWL